MSRWPTHPPRDRDRDRDRERDRDRDRSPTRLGERRPSATYSGSGIGLPGPAQAQSQNPYRSSANDPNQIPIPSGPKADNPRGAYRPFQPPRGRGGFGTRPDGWERDRESREARPAPNSYRRDDERPDWQRRERDFNQPERGALNSRDGRGYVGRNRSASPGRPPRRDSKESLYSNFSRPSEPLSSYAPAARGATARGRGRGDWDRSRGRNSFVADRDRDLFSPRSRSRDGWREKERDRERPRDGEVDRGDRYDRRDVDRSRERGPGAGREYDSRPRERSPGRSDSGIFGAPASTPKASANPASSDTYSGTERMAQRTGSDFMRRPSALLTPSNLPRDNRKESEPSDYFLSRSEAPRRDAGGSRQLSPQTKAEPSDSASLDYGPPPAAVPFTTVANDKVTAVRASAPPIQTPRSEIAAPGKKEEFKPAESRAYPSQHIPSETSAPDRTAARGYGPPPAPVPAGSPTPEKTEGVRVAGSGLETPVASQKAFQPPTGPKQPVRRPGGYQPPAQTPQRAAASDPWSMQESHSRMLRPGPTLASGSPSAESTLRRPEQNSESRNPSTALVDRNTSAAPSDRSLPPGVPLGPRVPMRSVPNDVNAPATPSIAPSRAPRPLSSDFGSSVPTGPRLETARPPHHLWNSPDYRQPTAPRPPSIMSGMNNRPFYNDNRDRQSYAMGPQRLGPGYPSQAAKPRPYQPSIMNRTTDNFDIDTGRRSETIFGSGATLTDHRRQSVNKAEGVDADESMNVSSEDEDDLDEDDFLNSEDKHQKEMKVLEAKKPLPPLKDPVTVALLLRIQMLGMIANSVMPAPFEGEADEVACLQASGTASIGLVSPERQPGDTPEVKLPHVEFIQPIGRPLKDPPINPIPTPPIEDLPFLLKNKEPQFQVFEESDNEIENEDMSTLVVQDIEKAAWEWHDEWEELRGSYEQFYKSWRHAVSELELKRELKASTPTPASPALSIAPSITPQLTHERTRGGKNATDLDLQNALRISEQSAREEEERRLREKSKPNYETEAVVPSMLLPAEVDISRFKDTNQLIQAEIVLDKFALIPPVDDFTDDEQKIFVSYYCQYPKKWGKIAEYLPGRNYQQCISHYYLTKDEANYKESFRKAQPKKRGRRTNMQPRSMALLIENGYAEDSENPPMTDSGRPKRAAAPVFGDAATDPDTTPVPQTLKRLVASRDTNGEPGPVKATRGRKAGTVPKTRRTKAQMQEDQARIHTLQLNGNEISPQKGSGLGSLSDRHKPLRGGGTLKPDPSQGPDLQGPMNMDVPTMAAMSMNDYPVAPAVGPAVTGTGPQITSYWSVPEQQKFPNLVAYFGKDFAAIAEFMKTKSVIMIKNHYQRQLAEGKNDLKEAADAAELRRYRGEPMGSPPTPVAPPKRRYEAVPSMAAGPRPIASALESPMPKTEPLPPTVTGSLIDDFPSNTIHRGAKGEVMAKPRSMRDITNQNAATLLPQQRAELESGSERFSIQQPRQMQGPPRGFFNPESRERQELHPVRMGGHAQDQSPPLHPSRSIDLTQPEVVQRRPSGLSHQNAQPPTRDLHSQHQSPSSIAGQLPWTEDARPHQQAPFGHSRQNSSSGAPLMHTSNEAFHDLALRRHEPLHRGLIYGLPSASSPISSHSQTVTAPRVDLTRPSSTPITNTTEPPRTTAKRSNIMSILNDDPPEPQPPAKRPSLEATRPPSLSSPSIMPQDQRRHVFPPSRGPLSAEEVRESRQQTRYDSAHGHTQPVAHQAVSQGPPPDYSSPGIPNLGRGDNNQWLHHLDPRQPYHGSRNSTLEQPSTSEPTGSGLHPSLAPGPTTSQYSVAPPPNPQPSTLPGLQRLQNIDMPNRIDQSRHTDHRRFLGQINLPGHIPSPPPQQQMQLPPHTSSHQVRQPYRSTSGSSQHGRVSSIGYSQGHTQQPIQQQQQQQTQQQIPQQPPHSLTHSASTTPVSALHQHRSRGSTTFESRLGLQHPLQQQQHQAPSQPQPQSTSQQQQQAADQQERHRRDFEMQQRLLIQQNNQQQEMLYQEHMAQQQQQQQRHASSYPGLDQHPRSAAPPTRHGAFTPPITQQQQQQQKPGLGHGLGLGLGMGLGGGGLYEMQGQGPRQGQQQGGHYRQASQGQPPGQSGAPEERR